MDATATSRMNFLAPMEYSHCSKAGGGPLTRFHFKLTLTSTRLAILMNGMPLFMPYSLRSKAMVPMMFPDGLPLPSSVSFNFSFLVTPRMVKSPSTSKVRGPVCVIFVDLNVM